MAQYQLNRELAALYARKAREARYRGAVLRGQRPGGPPVPGGADGEQPRSRRRDGLSGPADLPGPGLRPGGHERPGGLLRPAGPRFASFLTDGRTFGPHGEDLVVANSIDRYDDGLSRLLTERTVHANLQMREMGFKPLCGPGPVLRSAESAAVSAGPVALLVHIPGRRVHGGPEPGNGGGHGAGRLPLPRQLQDRLQTTMDRLRAID